MLNKLLNIKIVLWFLVIVVGWIFLTFRITDVPPGINGDEASIGYNAILLSQTGKDENGRFLPLFVQTLNGRDWKQPLTVYSTALAFHIFGSSLFLLRAVSVFYVLLSAVLLYLLLKKIIDRKIAIMGAIIFVTTPIIVIQSHLALENIIPVPLVTAWLLILNKYFNSHKEKYLFWSGVFLGLALFSYNGMRLISPVLLILTVFSLLFTKKLDINSLKYLLAGFCPFLVLIYISKFFYPGAIFGSARPIPITSYQQFLLPYLSSFDLTFLFMTGDTTPYHSTGKHGVFLLATLPLFIIGCVKAFRAKSPIISLTLAVFFFSPLIFGLVDSVHRGSRLLAIVPAFIVLTSLGLKELLGMGNPFKRKLITFGAILLLILNISDFLGDYWFSYPGRVKVNFTSNAHITFKELKENSIKFNLLPAIQEDIYMKESVAAQFFEKVYFFPEATIWSLSKPLPDNSIILANPDNLTNEQKNKMQELDLKLPESGLLIPGSQ